MKKRLRHRIRLIRILFACAVTIGSTTFTIAAEKKEARVTQIVHDLLLLVSNAAAPSFSERQRRPRRSRANRQRFARRAYLHGSNVDATRREHVFSFGEGARDFDLASGSVLLYVPKRSGKGRINTAVATVAGTSFTAMAEYHPKSWLKFIVLEGHGSVSLNHHPGETRKLRAGQMIVVPAGVTKLAEPQEVDLSKLIKISLLITKFPALPNVKMIFDRSQQSTDFAAE